jgi:hypothetical protein
MAVTPEFDSAPSRLYPRNPMNAIFAHVHHHHHHHH